MGLEKVKGQERLLVCSVRTLAERSLENDQEIYACFVDYEKAFNRVNWLKLMEILGNLDVDWKNRS